MSRHPSEQNLPDNVTSADIEKHFAYGEDQQYVACSSCRDELPMNSAKKLSSGKWRCFQCDEELTPSEMWTGEKVEEEED